MFPTNYHFFKHLSSFVRRKLHKDETEVFKDKATAESAFDELCSSEDYT